MGNGNFNWSGEVVLMETSQGHSLSINNSRFYPYTTSRICSVAQAMSDASIPCKYLAKTLMSIRTFPIRVGNVKGGESGGGYPDQKETTWDALGVKPELTSTTKRQRRVFTFSRLQFRGALRAHEPEALFVNFLNYLKTDKERDEFLRGIVRDYVDTLNRPPEFVLMGMGANNADVDLWKKY